MGSVFFLLGCLFLIASSFFLSRGMYFLITSEKTDGTVLKIDWEGENTTVHVVYYVGERWYTTIYPIHHTGMKEGDKVTIYYDNDDPSVVRQVSSHWFAFIPFFIGFVFTIVGGMLRGSILRYERLKRYLMVNGKKRRARIVSANINYSIRVSTGSKVFHPRTIVCSVEDSSKKDVKIFKSHLIWEEVPKDIDSGKFSVHVWLDPNNPKKYYVDPETIHRREDDIFF